MSKRDRRLKVLEYRRLSINFELREEVGGG
jgi:hypothetical protein